MVESSAPSTFDKLPSVDSLVNHYKQETSKTHLRDLLQLESRNQSLRATLKNEGARSDSIILDLTHSKIDESGYQALLKVAEEVKL